MSRRRQAQQTFTASICALLFWLGGISRVKKSIWKFRIASCTSDPNRSPLFPQPFYPVGASACNPGLYFHVVKDLQVIISSPPFSGSSAAQVRFSGSMVLSVCQMSFSATKRIIWIVEVSEQRKTCTCCWKGCFTTITNIIIIIIIIIILLLLLRFLIAIFILIYYSQYIHCWCHSFWSFLFSLWSLDHNYVKA